MRTAILGGGITGVTLANRMQAAGMEYELFEADARLGGLCKSETIEGFVADCTGGHIIFSKNKRVLDFMLDALKDIGTHKSPRKSAIYYHGDYVQYPFENGLADLPPQDNFECLEGLVEAHYARRNGSEEPTNFKDWCQWRFGPGICEKFMDPYNEKIWKVPLEELSTTWVSGRIPDAPIGDVLKASIGIRTEGYKHQAVFWYPMTGGFESVVKAVAAPLDSKHLHLQTRVKSLRKVEGGFDVDGEHFERVVSTIPLPELLRLLNGVPDTVQAAGAGLSYTSVASFLVAIDAPSNTDRSWIYFAQPEFGPFNRVTHLSNYSPKNAPEGKSSLMAEVTYRGDIDLDETAKAVEDGLVKDGLVKREDILWTKGWKNKYAYILYTHGLEERLATVRDYLSGEGIDILGRFGNYNYFNSDQCIEAVFDYVDQQS